MCQINKLVKLTVVPALGLALRASLLGNPTAALAQRPGSSGGHAPAQHRSLLASHALAPHPEAPRAPSVDLSPQCREVMRTAKISGVAVATGTCFATRNPWDCATAGVAGVKFAADTQKMIKVCQPPPASRPATHRVAPPWRGH